MSAQVLRFPNAHTSLSTQHYTTMEPAVALVMRLESAGAHASQRQTKGLLPRRDIGHTLLERFGR